MAAGLEPQMLVRFAVVGLVAAVHVEMPSYVRIVPLAPTAYARVAIDQTPLRFSVELFVCVVHDVPFQRRMTPPLPTAKIVFAFVPNTLLSCAEVLLVIGAQRFTGDTTGATTFKSAYPPTVPF